MIALTLIGCAIGAAVFWLIVLVRPPTPDPLVMLARFDAARAAATTHAELAPTTAAGGAQTRLGRWISTELARRGIHCTSLRQDLALTGQSFDVAMGRKLLVAVGGFLIGLVHRRVPRRCRPAPAARRSDRGGAAARVVVLLRPGLRCPHRGGQAAQGVQTGVGRLPGLGVPADVRSGCGRAGAAGRGEDRSGGGRWR